jgi:hypothetical protein
LIDRNGRWQLRLGSSNLLFVGCLVAEHRIGCIGDLTKPGLPGPLETTAGAPRRALRMGRRWPGPSVWLRSINSLSRMRFTALRLVFYAKFLLTRAEDRAPVGTDPNAHPGVIDRRWGDTRRPALFSAQPTGKQPRRLEHFAMRPDRAQRQGQLPLSRNGSWTIRAIILTHLSRFTQTS